MFGALPALRANPAGKTPRCHWTRPSAAIRRAWMRINHVGEVCAQGLYFGQVAVARDAATRAHLLEAAQEETDHLSWCGDRLRELDSRPSLFNPLWYAGSYALGAVAALRGDDWSLGFVVETERQVEAHLDEHLDILPPADLAQPRDPVGDEGRRGPPCRPCRTGRRAHPAAADPAGDGVRFEGNEDGGLPALTPQPTSFNPTTPATISSMQASRGQDALSPNRKMPRIATPSAPIPVQMA